VPIFVERLQRSPAEAAGALVADSEAQGVRFVRRLVDERASFERLRLRTTNLAAAALYERLGFVPLAATRTVRISSRSRAAPEAP